MRFHLQGCFFTLTWPGVVDRMLRSGRRLTYLTMFQTQKKVQSLQDQHRALSGRDPPGFSVTQVNGSVGTTDADKFTSKATVSLLTVGAKVLLVVFASFVVPPWRLPLEAERLRTVWHSLASALHGGDPGSSPIQCNRIQLYCQVTKARGMCYGTEHTHTHTHTSRKRQNYNGKNVTVVQRVDLMVKKVRLTSCVYSVNLKSVS